MSIQELQQNPQDTSNFYLANTYLATINPNASSSLPTSPPPFTPPNYAVWVNALWFLSLVISITCALLATLLQQWARRYLKVTQPRYSPHKRARIRAFFAEGVDKFLLPWAVEALPTMLHLSLFLFFAGLAVFLWNVNLTIFGLVLSWIGLCTALYGCITFIPVLFHDSPYHTPLSLPAWHFVTGIRFLMLRTLEWITYSFDYFSQGTYDRFRLLAESYGRLLVQGIQKMAEETAFKSPPEIDTRAFVWTFDCLDEDHELERFFAGLPGFRSSKMVKDPLPDLTFEQQEKLLQGLIGLSDRTSSSDLLPEPVKIRRSVICGKALRPEDIPRENFMHFLRRIISGDHYGLAKSVEIVSFVRGWDNGDDAEITMINQAIVSTVVARAQRHDGLWFGLAADAMGLPESVLRSHATHGNDLFLAILIHVVRQQYSLFWKRYWPETGFLKVLEAAAKFDVLDTSPGLQHEFCALWNEVARADQVFLWYILRPIRNVYLTLHQHTDSAPTAFSAYTSDKDDILREPSTYPLCNIPGHHPDSTAHIHDGSPSTATPHPVLHYNNALDPTFPPDAPSLSVTTPVLADENTVDVPQIDNVLALAPSSCVHQAATGNLHDSATLSDPAATAATRDNPSARTIASTIRETSTTTASAPPHAEVSFQSNADFLAPHSASPETPSSTSPEPVLENILPKGTPPPLTIPCQSDQWFYPESHCSITASTSQGTSPRPTCAPGLVAATSDGGGAEATSSREDNDDLDLLPADRASQTTTQAIVDVLPQLLSLHSLTDTAATSPPQQKVDADHARDPHYDTV